MISPDRFVANKALDKEGWLGARRLGVTATQVAKASTPSGFKDAVIDLTEPRTVIDNPYMEFGREQETDISLWIKSGFGIFPNEWVIAKDSSPGEAEPLLLATPDGLSLDHSSIAEIKTTGKDWGENAIPIQYRRQVQWQLFVTGAEVCLFAWLLRAEVDGRMVPAWWEPKVTEIKPDLGMIEELSEVASRLWAEKVKLEMKGN
jgi:hypothetical protein